MPEKLIIASLEPIKVGQTFDSLPLHVTLMPWFEISDHNTKTLYGYLGTIARKQDFLELIGEDEAMFGPDENVPVRRLADANIRQMHRDIELAVRWSEGVACNSDYIREKYQPHVSHTNGRSFERGRTVKLSAMQVVDRDPSTRVRTTERIYDLGVTNNRQVG